mmetsp:Transcript_124468/g.265291  ORF Transcript_124468/g.265291 Transcript_124468/m.265291 type:complete len:203 (+) Transcript_124468:970-1578(+)
MSSRCTESRAVLQTLSSKRGVCPRAIEDMAVEPSKAPRAAPPSRRGVPRRLQERLSLAPPLAPRALKTPPLAVKRSCSRRISSMSFFKACMYSCTCRARLTRLKGVVCASANCCKALEGDGPPFCGVPTSNITEEDGLISRGVASPKPSVAFNMGVATLATAMGSFPSSFGVAATALVASPVQGAATVVATAREPTERKEPP